MKEELCPECEMELDEDEFEIEKFRCPRCGKIFELAVWEGEAGKREISEKELLSFLRSLKKEISSQEFWDNLDDKVAEKYDNFSHPGFITELVVDYTIKKIKKKFRNNDKIKTGEL
jgi:Zn-finger nucleic acid-binding protein